MPIAPFIRLFESWGVHESLTLAQLRQKAITLLTITSMASPSNLAPRVSFFREQVKFNSDGSATFNFFGTKNDSQRSGFEVRIVCTNSVLTDPILCLNSMSQSIFKKIRNVDA